MAHILKRFCSSIIILFCLSAICLGAIVDGTNAGFVTSAPSADPGGASETIFDGDTVAMKITSPSDMGTVTQIGVYIVTGQTTAETAYVGIYSHDATNNIPNVIVGSQSEAFAVWTAGWEVIGSLSIALSASTAYWIATSITNSVSHTVDFDTNASYKFDRSLDPGLPTPWGNPGTSQTRLAAIYALYTPSGGARRVMLIQ